MTGAGAGPLGGSFALGSWRVRRAGYGAMQLAGNGVFGPPRATGESYCLAHHLTEAEDGFRTLMVASIRYLDTFVKQDGAWLFAERRLMVNWTDTRPSVP